jgi:hypothetical protein
LIITRARFPFSSSHSYKRVSQRWPPFLMVRNPCLRRAEARLYVALLFAFGPIQSLNQAVSDSPSLPVFGPWSFPLPLYFSLPFCHPTSGGDLHGTCICWSDGHSLSCHRPPNGVIHPSLPKSLAAISGRRWLFGGHRRTMYGVTCLPTPAMISINHHRQPFPLRSAGIQWKLVIGL